MKTYFARKGDSLWLIAQKYGISLDSLIAANPKITNPDAIDVGMSINIPVNNNGGTGNMMSPDPAHAQYSKQNFQHCSTSYTVLSGDTMWQIAKKSGVTLAALIKANPEIANPDQIDVGQKICIPGASMPNDNMPNDEMYFHKSKKGIKTTIPPTLAPTMEPVPPTPTEEYLPPLPPMEELPTSAPMPTLCPIPPMHPMPPEHHMPKHPMPTVCPMPPKPTMQPMPSHPCVVTYHHIHHICGCCPPHKHHKKY